MGVLLQDVQRAVTDDRYVFSDHADNMMRERGIRHWQIIQGLDDARLVTERPQTKPNPTVEVEQLLADGTSVKCVWALVKRANLAKLVTVHFLDR